MPFAMLRHPWLYTPTRPTAVGIASSRARASGVAGVVDFRCSCKREVHHYAGSIQPTWQDKMKAWKVLQGLEKPVARRQSAIWCPGG